MSKTVKLTIDSVVYDVSSSVIANSVKISYSLFNNLEPTTNKAEFQLAGNASVIPLILATTSDITAQILDGATVLFTGYLTDSYSLLTKKTGKQPITLSVEDPGIKKLKKCWVSSNELYTLFTNNKICDPANTANSIIHKIATLAGVTVSSSIPTISNITSFNIQDKDNKTYWDVLKELTYEFGYVFYFNEQGQFNLYKIAIQSVTPAALFSTNTNIIGEADNKAIEVKKSLIQYKKIALTWDEWETKSNIYVFSDSTGGDDNHPCNIPVAAGAYYPTGADASTFVYQEYKAETGQKIINVNSATSEIITDSGFTIEFENLGTRGKLRIRNTSAVEADIRKLKILANEVILVKSQNTTNAGESLSASPVLKYTAKHIHDTTSATNFANTLKYYYKYGNFSYNFKSKTNCALGSIVTLNDAMYLGLSEPVVIQAKVVRDNGIIEYTAIGVDLFNLSDNIIRDITVKSDNKLAKVSIPEITNPSITIGTTEVSLGGTASVIDGITVNGTVSGNAETASKLLNARTIGLSGKIAGTATAFDGAQNITINTTSAAITSAEVTDATSANTINTIVKRDSSGNFSAGTITASLSGNASTATKLATARSIGISGKVTGAATNFDGSGNITISTTAANITSAEVSDATASNTASTIVKRDATGGFSAGAINASGNVTIGGDLIINGTTTTVNATTVTLDDPIITLGGDVAPTVDDNKDRGVEFRWHNGTAAKVGFFGFDDSTGKFTFIPDATNASEVFSGTKGAIDANIAWTDVTGKPTTISGYGITDVGNGTLTLGVSGTGLSGSGTFTANQSGNSTFTVTSNATSANTASTIVARDASGNFTAGTITAALSGNATTASTLQNARNIAGVSFNGSANIDIPFTNLTSKPTTLSGYGITDAATSTHTHTFDSLTSKPTTLAGYGITDAATSTHTHTFSSLTSKPTTLSGYGITDAATSSHTHTDLTNATNLNTASTLVKRDSSGNFSAGTITASLTGNASSATVLQNARNIAGVSFNGSADISIPFANLSSKPTTLSGYGITDAASSSHTHSDLSNATSSNTANTLVKRDSSGNFSAGTITATSLAGTLSTAAQTNITSLGTLTGLTVGGNITQSGSYSINNAFVSGSLGTGWKIDYNSSVPSKSYLEVDNLMVRDTVRTPIFQKDVIKIENGLLYVSDSGVIADDYVGSNIVYFDIDKSATFAVNDIIKVKDVNISTGQPITLVKFTIASVGTASNGKQPYTVTLNSGSLSSLQKGMMAAKVSAGALLLDASSSNSPFLDVLSNETVKTRIGRLDGISGCSGYGLYSDNVFLTGKVIANAGQIGNWNITDTALYGGGYDAAGNNPDNLPGTYLNADGAIEANAAIFKNITIEGDSVFKGTIDTPVLSAQFLNSDLENWVTPAAPWSGEVLYQHFIDSSLHRIVPCTGTFDGRTVSSIVRREDTIDIWVTTAPNFYYISRTESYSYAGNLDATVEGRLQTISLTPLDYQEGVYDISGYRNISGNNLLGKALYIQKDANSMMQLNTDGEITIGGYTSNASYSKILIDGEVRIAGCERVWTSTASWVGSDFCSVFADTKNANIYSATWCKNSTFDGHPVPFISRDSVTGNITIYTNDGTGATYTIVNGTNVYTFVGNITAIAHTKISAPLDIYYGIYSDSSDPIVQFREDYSNAYSTHLYLGNKKIEVQGSTANVDLNINSQGSGNLLLNYDTAQHSGNVGICLNTTPTEKLQVGGNVKSSGSFISTVSVGTAPLAVTSTTRVDNLNADLLDGMHAGYSNVANSVVSRDANGDFAARTITANTFVGYLTGNISGSAATASSAGTAGTATTLQTARTIAISTGATGTATSFNGSANITIPITSLAASYLSGTIPSAVLGNSTVYIGSTAVALNRVTGSLALTGITSIDGNAATATKLAASKTIAGVSFDGSANISIPFANLSSIPTTLSGYGITDAAPSSHVGATGSAHGAVTTSVAGFMSAADKTKLDGIATGANLYTHPTGDGNLHVPATGTTNNQKVLKAGSTAGSIAWGTVAFSEIASKPNTLAGYGITDGALSTHNHTLDSLSNVSITSNTSGEILKWNGTSWINNTLAEAGIQPAGSYLTGNQTITVSGDATGSGTTSISLTLATSGVTAGTYKSVTVDAKGRVTSGTNPTTLSGYGITDAASSSHTHTFASLTSKPTTLSGYGITDAASSTHDHTSISGSAGSATTATNLSGGYASGNSWFRTSAVLTGQFIGNWSTSNYWGIGSTSANNVRIGAVTSDGTASTETCNLTVTGAVTATTLTASSKREYKENIKQFDKSALNILDAVDVVSFNYKNDAEKNFKVGFIADDTDEILSTKNHDKMDMTNSIGLLIKAVQELKAENEKLRTLLGGK